MEYFLLLSVLSTICLTESDVRFPTDHHRLFIDDVLDIHDIHCPSAGCPPRRGLLRGCCSDCSCDIETCTPTGNCCPHVFRYRNLPTIEETDAAQKMVCRYAQFRDFDQYGKPDPYTEGFRMVAKCADNFTDHPVVVKCESYKNHRPLDFDLLIPVTYPSARLTYQNRHCAACNHVLDQHLVRWNARLQCSEGTPHITSVATAIEAVLQSDHCDITYTPPAELDNSTLQTCEPSISECNVTKNWKTYDPNTERACRAYESVFYVPRNRTTRPHFRNVFCYECNGHTLPREKCKSDNNTGVKTDGGGDPFMSFGAILDPQPKISVTGDVILLDDANRHDVCSASQILDPIKDTCKDVTCLPPKAYRNGTCMDTISYLEYVLFEAFIRITLRQTVRTTQVSQSVGVLKSILGLQNGQRLTNMTQFYALYYKPVNHLNNSYPSSSLVEYFLCHIQGKKKDVNVLSFLNGVLELNGKNDTILIDDLITEGLKGKPSVVSLEFRYYGNIFKNGSDDLDNKTFFSQYKRLYQFGTLDRNISQVVTKLAGCPLIDIGDYQSENHSNGDLSVEELGFTFPMEAYTRKGNESIFICKSDFEVLTESKTRLKKNVANRPRPKDHSLALGILSLAMVVLSLVCLSLTLLTYFLFKDLQTQPGVNNMCLVGNLIIAQSLYQFGANQAGIIPDLFCQMIGALTHFFWLMSIFWMNVCSFHMYTVFSSLNRVQRNNHKLRRTALYTLYCFLASVLLVTVNVVVSMITSRGREVGYGRALCYVSDYFMNLYTFVAPVGLVVMVNLGLFVAVIIAVQRLPQNLRKTETNRNYIKIYAKLSCITGVFWLCGFLVYTGIVVFEYLFIIGAAGQGVYIFVSFMCNARVMELYRSLFQRSSAELSAEANIART